MKCLAHLENEIKFKGETEVEHVEDANMENHLNKDEVIVPHSSTKYVYEKSDVEEFLLVDSNKVDHIDFITPEYLPKPRSLTHQFSEFFVPRMFFKKSIKFILFPSHPCDC